MPKLPGIGQKDAVRVLEKRGFRVVRQGKHITLSNGAVMIQVPRGLTPDQFRDLL